MARARSLTLSRYCVVTIANATPFIPCDTGAVPCPHIVMFSGVYIGTFNWSTHPTSNCLPASATKVICEGSYVNSQRDSFIIESADPEQDTFKTANVGRIGKGTSIGHDPGTIKERAKLYAYMLLMPVSNGAGLGTSPSISWKNVSWRDSTASIDDTDLTRKGSITARRLTKPIVAPMPTEVIVGLLH